MRDLLLRVSRLASSRPQVDRHTSYATQFVAVLLCVFVLGGVTACHSDTDPQSDSKQSGTTSASPPSPSSASPTTATPDLDKSTTNAEVTSSRTLSKPSVVSEGIVTVCTHLPREPYAYLDDAGNPTGFALEVVRRAAKRFELQVRLVDVDVKKLSAADPYAWLGDCDILAGGYDEVAQQEMENVLFTQPYAAVTATMVSRGDPVKSLADLSGEVVGVARDSGAARLVSQANSSVKMLTFPNQQMALQALRDDKVSAVLLETPEALRVTTADQGFVRGAEFETSERWSFGVQPQNNSLRQLLDSTITLMRQDGSYYTEYNRWLMPNG